MEHTMEDIKKLQQEFSNCQKLLIAIGDEVRQYLLCIMLEGEFSRSRVIDITAKTNLFRPAVSHRMQILKNVGVVKSRKEGTCIYYYLDPADNEIGKVMSLCEHIKEIMKTVPDKWRRIKGKER